VEIRTLQKRLNQADKWVEKLTESLLNSYPFTQNDLLYLLAGISSGHCQETVTAALKPYE